jgi:hypothetical protein
MMMSVAILQPGCGDFAINMAVLIWTIAICVELIRHTFVKKQVNAVGLVGYCSYAHLCHEAGECCGVGGILFIRHTFVKKLVNSVGLVEYCLYATPLSRSR